jgi:hypothetical protein
MYLRIARGWQLGYCRVMTDRALPFPESLCHRCVHLRVVDSAKGSTFLMCQEPSLPKYGPQPVRTCLRFTPAGKR